MLSHVHMRIILYCYRYPIELVMIDFQNENKPNLSICVQMLSLNLVRNRFFFFFRKQRFIAKKNVETRSRDAVNFSNVQRSKKVVSRTVTRRGIRLV